jgi:hypothetical protein
MQKTKPSLIDPWNVNLHGWDATAEFWHGPTPLTHAVGRGRTGAGRIRIARSGFHGKVRCSVPGLPCLEFHTAVYDLMDIGVAIVHLDGAEGGPAGVIAVVPAARREHLRPEFAFEFVTLLSFFAGPSKPGSELAIHDYIDEVVRTGTPGTQVFTVETAELDPDVAIVLSAHFEHLAAAMVDWLTTRDYTDVEESEDDSVETCIPSPCAAVAFDGFAAAACAGGL